MFLRAVRFPKIFKIRPGQFWLGPEPGSKLFLVYAVVLVTLAVAANVHVRYAQLKTWEPTIHKTLTVDMPTFSTTDAPYFLSHAVSYKRNETVASFHEKRSYPNNFEGNSDHRKNTGLRDRPLLSVLIGEFANDNTPTSLIMTGNVLLIVTAALTAFAITICFGASGYWAHGAIASIGGGLSATYLARSSIGRIDTDQLNLGLFYLIFGLIVFAGKAKSKIRCLAWCVAAGILANIFMWWYGKSELIVMATFALAWLLFCLQRDIFILLAGSTTFFVLSGVRFFNPFASIYLQETVYGGHFTFPNTFQTITEIEQVPLSQILHNTSGSIEMGIFCLAGVALFLVKQPVIAIAYGPLIVFGLLNFVIGNRAIFYSAPIMWFGAVFLMTTSARFIAANLPETKYAIRRDQAATILAASIAMLVAWVNSPTDYLPRPSFPKPVLEGLASLKSTADPENSVVATWWDYGYASMFFNDLPTFHDGGAQTSPSTYFVAQAFLESEQTDSVGTLKFLSTKGRQGVNAEVSIEGLQNQFDLAGSNPSPDIYLVVTGQMAGWISSISQIGNWDIETGTPITPNGNKTGSKVFYEPLNCRLAGYPKRLNCATAAFDLEEGLLNGAPILSGWAHSRDGEVVRRKNFDHDSDFALQIVQNGYHINAYFLHRQLFESTFNELYFLGQIDNPSISLHYDDYPHIRIYKLDGTPHYRSGS